MASAAAGVWGLESHSSLQQISILRTLSPSLSQAVLLPSHTGQTARQAGLDTEAQPHREEQRGSFQSPPFISSVPWQPLTIPQHMQHY